MLQYIDSLLPETGTGFILIGAIFLIGLFVIMVKVVVQSYRRQRAVDQSLLGLLELEKREFFNKLNELGFFFPNRLYLVRKMGTGIASKSAVVQILWKYLVFRPEQTGEVVFATLEHFEQTKPFFRCWRWFDSPKWEWSKTREFISMIHTLFIGEDQEQIATRYDLLRALDQQLLIEKINWEKDQAKQREDLRKRRQDKYWLLAKKVLHRPEPIELAVVPTKEIPASADTLP